MTEPLDQAGARKPDPAGRLFGWLLAVLGGLWVLLTGGCTLTLMTTMIGEFGHDATGGAQLVVIYFLIGAVCTAPGAVLLFVGLWLLRKSKAASG